MINWLKNKQKEKLIKKANSSSINKYIEFSKINKIQTFSDSEFLILDFETTGLNPKKDKILSVGWAVISKNKILLNKSFHHYVFYNGKIPNETVVIHQITEQKAITGENINDIFCKILNNLNNKILVVHYADIEINFLNLLAMKFHNTKMPINFIDTLQIAYKKKLEMSRSDELSLSALRESYNLPRYKNHNAMIDAIATAELLLAQVSERGNYDEIKVIDLFNN